MQKINPLRLVHARDFDRAFTEPISQPDTTHEQAFYYLNELYLETFGKEKYSDYNSYRVTRANRLKAKR